MEFVVSFLKPPIVERYYMARVICYDININIKPTEGGYKWEQVHLTEERWDYGGIIDALVTYKYPNDKMQAVINNYLLEPENEEYVKAFNEMQSWRKEAKEIAKQALEYELH